MLLKGISILRLNELKGLTSDEITLIISKVKVKIVVYLKL